MRRAINHRPWLWAPILGAAIFACAAPEPGGEKRDPSTSDNVLPGPGSLGDGADQTSKPPTELEACATSTSRAEDVPLFLVFMIDRSLSMFGAKGANRWGPCKSATTAFFASAEAKGMSASIAYFPQSNILPSCDAASYSTPAVAMTALPNPAFAKSLNTTLPEFGTPTEPAMTGAVEYAKKVASAEAKDGKVAIVLVGDGEPVGCGSNITGTASIVGAVKDTIPTYVIGVGDAKALDAIASAGGTTKAIAVAGKGAADIEKSFLAALANIRSAALACEYTIPAPPKGETFERGKVNIVHQQNGTPAVIPYDQECKNGGWRYDDAAAPKHVVLCEKACNDMKTNPGGKVDVLFGCETRTGPVK